MPKFMRDVENRFGLSVFVVGKLSVLEFHGLAGVGERNFGHDSHCSLRVLRYTGFSCFIILEKRIAEAFAVAH